MAAATGARRFPRRLYKLHEVDVSNPYFRLKKKDPEDLPTQKVLRIVRTYGPLRAGEVWEHAEKEGIKSKTHTRNLLKWLQSKYLIYTQCFHENSGLKPRKGVRQVENRTFKFIAVPPAPEKLQVLNPKPPEPRIYTKRCVQKRLKRLKAKLGDAYIRPAKLKKQRLAAGIVYKPYKYGDPEKLHAIKGYFERRAAILEAVVARTTGPYAAAAAAAATKASIASSAKSS